MNRSMPLVAIILILLLVAPSLAAQAGQTNPFVKSSAGTGSVQPELPEVQPETMVKAGWFSNIAATLVDMQRHLTQMIADLVRAVQPGEAAFNPLALASLLVISLLYGIIHALGPGHGKAIASSFFLTRPARLRHGIELGYWLALIHAAVAITLVLVLTGILRLSVSGGTELYTWWLGTVAYSMVAAIGVFMLADAIVQQLSHGQRHLHFHFGDHRHGHDHRHQSDHGHTSGSEHEHGPNHDHSQSEPAMATSRELLGLGFLSAIIPCPGAVGIMVFALGANAFLTGALAVMALSVGMGITSSLAGISGILVRRGVLGAGKRVVPKAVQNLGGIVRIVGSLCFTLLGVLLLATRF